MWITKLVEAGGEDWRISCQRSDVGGYTATVQIGSKVTVFPVEDDRFPELAIRRALAIVDGLIEDRQAAIEHLRTVRSELRTLRGDVVE